MNSGNRLALDRLAWELILTPEPRHVSWEAYLAATTDADRRSWCRKKVRVANRPRLMSGPPVERITVNDVLGVLMTAMGRCHWCGSLAVEGRPSDPVTGAPLPWTLVGRRIGSLDHVTSRFDGGSNTIENFVWACLWCNTWPAERTPGATDHGAIQ